MPRRAYVLLTYIIAANGKAIIFYRCNFFFFYFVSIDERPAMGSQPNLASRLEVVSIYKFPSKISKGPSPKCLAQNIKYWTTFPRIPHLKPHISRTKHPHRQTKMLMTIFNVSRTCWQFPDRNADCCVNIGVETITTATNLVNFSAVTPEIVWLICMGGDCAG